MEFLILGPLGVRINGRQLPLSESREQNVLAALLLNANRVVPLSQLIAAVWDDQPPRTARKAVRNCIAVLRSKFRDAGIPESPIETAADGYVLPLRSWTSDLVTFDSIIGIARQAAETGDLGSAIQQFGAALAIWRGDALAGVQSHSLRAAATRLNEQRQAIQEELAAYEVALGHSHRLVHDLSEMVATHPLRERLRCLLMATLFYGGRRAEALEVYRQGREILVAELGVEPGPELATLQQAILNGAVPMDIAAPWITLPAGAQRGAHHVMPRQLPADVSGFTGRAQQLAILDQLVQIFGQRSDADTSPPVLMAITGMAGVGKTSLAVHWAHHTRSWFPDGDLYVNLRGYDTESPVAPEQALDRFLRALGVPKESIPSDIDGMAALYRSVLDGRRMLILLDNARDVAHVRPLLPASSACLVLVTSRSQLAGLVVRDAADHLSLTGLSRDDAVTLLRHIIGSERVDTDPDAAEALAATCAYLPLALRIAAHRLAARPHLAVRDLAQKLTYERERLNLLSTIDDDSSAVNVVFSWSYGALPKDAARAFRLLGLHAGPDISTPAAAALLATTVAPTSRLLEKLVSVHLLEEVGQDRYRFHDLVRVYAADQVDTNESDATRVAAVRRELEWYLYTADNAVQTFSPPHLRAPLGTPEPACTPLTFTNARHALAWCEAERSNLVAAIKQAVDHGMYDIGWKLPAALWEFFNTRKYWKDWIATHQAGLKAAGQIGDQAGESWTLNNLGAAYLDLREYKSAIEHFQRALEIQERISDRETAGWTHYNLGEAYRRIGRYQDSIDNFRQALVISSEFDEYWGQSWTLTMLGDTYRELRNFDDAIHCLQRALEIRQEQEISDPLGDGWTLKILGDTHRELGEFQKAIAYTERALTISQENGLTYVEGPTLNNLGEIYHAMGQTNQAREWWRQALNLYEKIADPRAKAVSRRLQACDEPGSNGS